VSSARNSKPLLLKNGQYVQHFFSLQSRYTFQVLVHIPPRSSCADAWSSPPVINVLVKFVGEVIVQHSAQAAKKLVVNHFSSTLPPKVRVVKVVVCIKAVQICGNFLWRLEFIHVYVRAVWRNEGIFFRPGPHHYGQDVVTGTDIRTVEIEVGIISNKKTLLLKLS
jgi:hypothetical protein